MYYTSITKIGKETDYGYRSIINGNVTKQNNERCRNRSFIKSNRHRRTDGRKHRQHDRPFHGIIGQPQHRFKHRYFRITTYSSPRRRGFLPWRFLFVKSRSAHLMLLTLNLSGMVLAQMKSVPIFPAKESLLRAGRAKHEKIVD